MAIISTRIIITDLHPLYKGVVKRKILAYAAQLYLMDAV